MGGLVDAMREREMQENLRKHRRKEEAAKERLRQVKEEKALELAMKKEESRLLEQRRELTRKRHERSELYHIQSIEKKLSEETNKYKTRKYVLEKITQERRNLNEKGAIARKELQHRLKTSGESMFQNPKKLQSLTKEVPSTFALDFQVANDDD